MSDKELSSAIKVSPKDLVILSSAVSPSHKYELFYGEHYVQGRKCYDVGALNCSNGEITRRHYRLQSDDAMNKAASLAYWEEFYQKMMSTREAPEETEGETYVRLN